VSALERRIRVGSAPCSWGVLDGFDLSQAPGYAQVLDGMAETGYEGTEYGDPGFMPDDADLLRRELAARSLTMIGAFVPATLADPVAHAPALSLALRTARLLAACAAPDDRPFVVLADDPCSDPVRLKCAGRIQQEQGLTAEQWRTLARGADSIARAVRDETGLRTVFHHHSGSFVETPSEIETLLDITAPDLIGLCLDTGHYIYGGGDALDALKRFGGRVWHVHFKDCPQPVLDRARAEGWDYLQAVAGGLFCELGTGLVDFPSLMSELERLDYRGWIVVEDEFPPGTRVAKDSARRDREFLKTLGL